MTRGIHPYRSVSRRPVLDVEAERRDLVERQEQRTQTLPAEPEYREAFGRWLRSATEGRTPDPIVSDILLSEVERRDLGVAAGGPGGYLVPQSFYDELVVSMKYASPVREMARTWTSTTGADAPLPQVDPTELANVGGIQAENVALTSLDVPFTQKTMKAFMYQSLLVKASWQLAEDSAFPLEGFLADLIGARIGRIQNTHFTTGTGTGMPEGFVTAGVVSTTMATGTTAGFGAGAAAVTNAYGGLVNLSASVDPAYRRHPSCGWMMADTVYTQLRLLADTAGRPLVIDAEGPGGYPMLLGWPVLINNDMPTFGVSQRIIGFGAWSKFYVIRDVVGLTVRELKERFADQLQRGFYGYLRSDGRIADTKAVRLLATSAT